ncbi:MAG: hypothetical protein J7L15_02490 [Clostridiales bacterium]|nr:hypothetical protein [Clostridiales bacterium]
MTQVTQSEFVLKNSEVANTGKVLVKIQNIEWFTKNCYMDNDGDWWRHKELQDLYYNHNHVDGDNLHATYLDTLGTMDIIGKISEAEFKDFKHWGWAVEKYITKEENPEYFL